jgi:hypothetical protein
MSGLTKQRISDLEIDRAELERQLNELRATPTLRQRYAMAALTGLLADHSLDIGAEATAKLAFSYADEMMLFEDDEHPEEE